jgi:hypothetical protein
MTFLGFCLLASLVFVLLLIAAIIVYNHVSEEGGFALGCVTVIVGVTTIICWITMATSKNDENVDRNYCESLQKRGHQTQFFVYNLFNHECYILVDKQWMEVKNSPFASGID